MAIYLKKDNRTPITKSQLRENERMQLLCFDSESSLSFFVGVFTWKITRGDQWVAGGTTFDDGIETYNRLAKL